MRAFVSAVMTQRLGQHIRLPPFGLLVPLERRGLALESGIVLFDLFRRADNYRADAVGMRRVEAHLIADPLRPFAAAMGAFPPDIDTESVAAIGPEHRRFVPERVVVRVVFKDLAVVAPA